jgi:trehalose-phosphatase
MGHTAIRYLHQAFPREEMVALYLAADVMLVTALRDGMNLVAKEYVASRVDNRGVLLLSEFAGAADELGSAVRVNPHDIEGLKDAIVRAVEMPAAEQGRRMRSLRKRVQDHDVEAWSSEFLEALRLVKEGRTGYTLPPAAEAALERIANTGRLLVALDFDGTLAPLEDEPMNARMLPAAREAVEHLLDAPDTVVAFVSGRSLADLREIAEHADDSQVFLAGSHGVEFWAPGIGVIEPAESADDVALRDRLRARAEEATAGMDGVWIEPKTFGFGVHTRAASAETAAAADAAVDAIVAREAPAWRRRTGHNIVEYAFRQEGKDSAVAALRERTGATAVLFAGDDITDEDALRSLQPGDLGVHIGTAPSAASVIVPDIAAFAALLQRLADLRASAQEYTRSHA